jgi:(R,R)-butanediol dehydrogenase / meso-butanediol dehydrogenase / diacetyl reductase
MRAARLHGRLDLRVEDVAVPEPGPGQVAVRVAHNGLCGTDLHEYFAGPTVCTDVPHPLTGAVLPQVMGHEFAGTVAEVGDGVTGVAVGDRVCVEPIYSCGHCAACTDGYQCLCSVMTAHGCAAPGGGLSERTVVPGPSVHRLPDDLSLVHGALVEPLAVAYNGVALSEIRPDDVAVVFGAGPIGIGTFLCLGWAGVERVVIVEPSAARRRAVSALGADDVLDPAVDEVPDVLRRRTGGRGATVAFDAAGSPAAFDVALRTVAPRGRMVVMAVYEDDVSWNPISLLRTQLHLVGSLGYRQGVFDTVIGHLAATPVPTAPWVDHVPLDRVVEGLGALRRGEAIKLLVDLPG